MRPRRVTISSKKRPMTRTELAVEIMRSGCSEEAAFYWAGAIARGVMAETLLRKLVEAVEPEWERGIVDNKTRRDGEFAIYQARYYLDSIENGTDLT